VVNPMSANRSPYRVSLTDFVLRFADTDQRRSILDGFLRYRASLHAVGLTCGFQWVNGSFLEHVEITEGRAPNDVDVVTFYRLLSGATQATVQALNADLFDHDQVKKTYHADAYLVGLDSPPENLVAQSAYWYSVWSHRRNQAWKGYVEIDLDRVDDESASAILTSSAGTGGSP